MRIGAPRKSAHAAASLVSAGYSRQSCWSVLEGAPAPPELPKLEVLANVAAAAVALPAAVATSRLEAAAAPCTRLSHFQYPRP